MKRLLVCGGMALALALGGCATTSPYSPAGTVSSPSITAQQNLYRAQTAFGITMAAVNVAVDAGRLKGANARSAQSALTAANTALALASAAIITADPAEAQRQIDTASAAMANASALSKGSN